MKANTMQELTDEPLECYNKIRGFLRSVLHDEDFAEYSECLDLIVAAIAQQAARHAEELAAYEVTVSNRDAEIANLWAQRVSDEFDAVAIRYAHKLALDLECVLADYSGKWYETALQTLSDYRSAMNAIHDRESPTHMGEPVLSGAPAPEPERKPDYWLQPDGTVDGYNPKGTRIPLYLAPPEAQPERKPAPEPDQESNLTYEQGIEDGKLIERGMSRLRAAEAQPERKPMDFNAMDKIVRDAQIAYCLGKTGSAEVEIIRAVEAHHGIVPPEDK